MLEDIGFAARFLDDVAEDALRAVAAGGRQQADIFRKEAEYELGQEIGDARRLGVPVAHIVGDQLKGVGSLLGYLIGVAARVQAFRRVEHGAQPAQYLAIGGYFIVAEAIDALLGIGKIGMDFPMVDIGDD
ncbi:MAG: hypothetical protein OXG23_11410 [Chloroflexi bacterium]|nr:hypothetical protein [Chloroflexota bacterium]